MSDSLQEFRTLKGFTLVNRDKLQRAVFGSEGSEGKLQGGVGEDAEAYEILAAYDKLGGLILKGKAKVKTGSFFDFEKKSPRKKPNVVLEFRDLKGKKVELGENEEVPIEVQAAEKLRADDAEEVAAAAAKKDKKKEKAAGKDKKAKDADFEEEEIVDGEDEPDADEDVE